MIHYKNLQIIGTSHISGQSIREVEHVISTIRPKIVAIEIDQKRLPALLSGKRAIKLSQIKHLGLKGFLINLLGSYIENKLGQKVNILPGSEMKAAIHAAKSINAKVALIDQDIDITLKRLSKQITAREKLKFLKEILAALLLGHHKIKIDLHKVPSKQLIITLTNKIKKDYPSIYKVLIEERDFYMAKALYKLSTQNPNEKIVAVVGAGHEDGIISNLKLFEKA